MTAKSMHSRTEERSETTDRAEMQVVPQRMNGDCVIAAWATVLSRSYEDVAAGFGFPVDVATGKPAGLDHAGLVFMVEDVPCLVSQGYQPIAFKLNCQLWCGPYPGVAPLTTREIKGMREAEMFAFIAGSRAVIYTISGKDDRIGHAVAWDGEKIVDCDPHKPADRCYSAIGFVVLV